MAANDYHNTNTSYPLRPNLPYHDSHDAPPSPLTGDSPFDDRTYSYSHLGPSQSYTGAGGRLHNEADPFEDDNAIPMNARQKATDSTTSVSPILPHQVEDPFVREADPRKKRRRREPVENGWFKGKITWVVYVLTVVQIVVFIAEIAVNGVKTGSPIEIQPSFNPMIGPSPYVLINMGSRYQPCMHSMLNVTNSSTTISWPCPQTTNLTRDTHCTLGELCGFGVDPALNPPQAVDSMSETSENWWITAPAPGQWWRFIVPIFLHAGIIHIGFNLLLQMTLGRDVERLIGSIRFALVYFASGIFGFVLGGNFAASGIASCGCSGSLFGILAITLLDLLYTWHQRTGPIKDLLFILVDVVIAFILGLLPGLDNFSHIGGFLMGLVLGVCILRSPASFTRSPSEQETARYSGISAPISRDGREQGLQGFAKEPLAFFQHRRGMWWAWWIVRVLALVGCLIGFILLLKNFYEWRTTCEWCKYLSCLPVTVGGTNWCDVGNLNFTTNATDGNSGSSRRDLFVTFANGRFNPMENLF